MWVVYVTADPLTGRYYVGKTSTAYLARGYQGSGLWVQRAIAAGNQLVTEVLSTWESEADAYEAEHFVVMMLRDFDPSCMNMAEGGLGGAASHPLVRAKLSAAQRKVAAQPGERQRMSERATAAWQSKDRSKETIRLQILANDPQAKLKRASARRASWLALDPAVRADREQRMRTHLARLNEVRYGRQ